LVQCENQKRAYQRELLHSVVCSVLTLAGAARCALGAWLRRAWTARWPRWRLTELLRRTSKNTTAPATRRR